MQNEKAITILKFTKYEKNTLLGFFDVKIGKWGMEIRGLSLFQKNDSKWISFPSRSYENDSGEKKYQNYINFPDKSIRERFQKAVLAELAEFMPSEPEPGDADVDDDIPF